MQDALLQVVWRSPGGDTDASFVVGGREIDRKMSNVDEIGQFKAQTSTKVLLRPFVLNLSTSVLFSTCPIDQVLVRESRSEGMIFHDHFWFEERLPGVQFRWLTPRGSWGGLVHARKKKQSEQVSRGLVGSEAQSRAQRL